MAHRILRWDGIIPPGATMPQPGISIVPDASLTTLLMHQPRVAIKITGTDSAYDNVLAYATVIPSTIAGGFRPNYDAATHQVVVLPEMVWNGYPADLGTITFLDIVELQEQYQQQQITRTYDTVWTASAVCGVCILLLIVLSSLRR
jgi:hypothetical protein